MFWSVVGRIVRARWLIVATCVVCSVLGGWIVVATAEPQYDATARVSLNLSRPTVSGMKISRKTVNGYMATQLELIRNPEIVAAALESIGLMDNPDLIAKYAARPANDTRDYRTWLAGTILPTLRASMVDDSDLVEIRYGGSTPEMAQLVTGAIRDAYIESNIMIRRQTAQQDVDWQQKRVKILSARLAQLEATQTELERKSGVVLGADGLDIDSRRLTVLTQPRNWGVSAQTILSDESPSRTQLASVEADIEIARARYGPNHPIMAQLERKRAALEVAARNETNLAAAAEAAVASRGKRDEAAIEAARAKALANKPVMIDLTMLQEQITATKKALEDSQRAVAASRQQASTMESGLTSIGPVDVAQKATFPNKQLILGGTALVGLVTGVLLAVFVELLNLRVRTTWGLSTATNLPMLGVIPAAPTPGPKPRRLRVRRRERKSEPALA